MKATLPPVVVVTVNPLRLKGSSQRIITSIEELLAWTESNSPLSVVLDGLIWDELPPSLIAAMGERLRNGRLEMLHSLYYLGSHHWSRAEDVAWQLRLSGERFTQAQYSPSALLIDPLSLQKIGPEVLRDFSPRFLVLDADLSQSAQWQRHHNLPILCPGAGAALVRRWFVDSEQTLAEAVSGATRILDPVVPEAASLEALTFSIPITESNDTWFEVRSQEIREVLSTLPGVIGAQPNHYANQQKVNSITKWFLRAQHPLSDPLATFRWFTKNIQYAQVEIDSILHPEVNPEIGWCAVEYKENSLSVLDTPFLRFYFSETGIDALEYKPRKHSVFRLGSKFGMELQGHAKQLRPRAADSMRLLRTSPDLAVVRMGYQAELFEVIQLLQVKAGLGAHLPNATSGFSLETWIEGDAPAAPDPITLCMPFSVPSYCSSAVALRALGPVGAVSDNAIRLEAPQMVVDEGPNRYGVRVIDGLEHWVVDFRFSKAIEKTEILVKCAEGSDALEGLELRFSVSAKRIIEDVNSITLFVSIA